MASVDLPVTDSQTDNSKISIMIDCICSAHLNGGGGGGGGGGGVQMIPARTYYNYVLLINPCRIIIITNSSN